VWRLYARLLFVCFILFSFSLTKKSSTMKLKYIIQIQTQHNNIKNNKISGPKDHAESSRQNNTKMKKVCALFFSLFHRLLLQRSKWHKHIERSKKKKGKGSIASHSYHKQHPSFFFSTQYVSCQLLS
jgi:hypothetical protein